MSLFSSNCSCQNWGTPFRLSEPGCSAYKTSALADNCLNPFSRCILFNGFGRWELPITRHNV